MARVLSGIQPTGDMHIGNYLGAVRNWVNRDQHESDAIFIVVDLHALTIPGDPKELRAKVLETATMLLAAGLDESLCTLFIQSHVPEHAQLAWVLQCVATTGELQRMTQFKDKAAKGGADSSTAGLFTYPALMAADILLYDTEQVPVGHDQKQHVELTRDVAERFNSRYGQTFVVPEPIIPPIGARIMDLQDPTKKMSKSTDTDSGCVYLLDDDKTIEKKFKRAVTDTEGDVVFDPQNRPGVANLLSIFSAVTGKSPNELANGYQQYGPLKADVASAVIESISPIRERYKDLSADPGEVSKILKVGADKAEQIASKTLERAYTAIGLN